MPLIKIIAWEFVQNLPLVTGFILALRAWQRNQYAGAIAWVIAGSLVGALLIRLTETRIVARRPEPLPVTLVNIAVMSLLMIAIISYLAAGWSSWQIDLLVGGAAGAALAIAQNLAARKRIGVGHLLAFVLAFPLALIGVRALANTLPILVVVLSITITVTVIISFIDYGVFL